MNIRLCKYIHFLPIKRSFPPDMRVENGNKYMLVCFPIFSLLAVFADVTTHSLGKMPHNNKHVQYLSYKTHTEQHEKKKRSRGS